MISSVGLLPGMILPARISKVCNSVHMRSGTQAKKPQKTARKCSETLGKGFEERLWAKGHSTVAGVDEAGRGPLAGPVRLPTNP